MQAIVALKYCQSRSRDGPTPPARPRRPRPGGNHCRGQLRLRGLQPDPSRHRPRGLRARVHRLRRARPHPRRASLRTLRHQVWQELQERGGGPEAVQDLLREPPARPLYQPERPLRLYYRLGINRFADMSWEEFRATRLGAAQNCSATLAGNHQMRAAAAAAMPETKDWREDGIVSPVKNQGHCGSCWTFSTTGALEAAYTQATGKAISLSEQQLVDCGFAFNNFGCKGGLPSQAFEYIKYNGGLDTEESYPYQGVNGICQFKAENVGVKVLDSVNITLGAEDELKDAVGLVRPVSVAFEVISGFRLYKTGVYTSDHCGTTPMDVNHAVLAVGYGVENGVPYWLIKNSWGADWGDEGYFKMEMGKNMCGVATCASYPVVA
uniref:Peptidase C1A papain C-terminal domain-containing protein n=1 Tax=Zea mays TaxID=4577 RepID=A0A804MNM4_MAIZE